MSKKEKDTTSDYGELLSSLTKLVTLIKNRTPGIANDEAQKQAVKKLRDSMEKGSRAKEAEKHNSEQAVKEIRKEQGSKAKQEAESRARDRTYSKDEVTIKSGVPNQPDNGLDHLELIRTTIPAGEIPTWINVNAITKSPSAAEYASRIAMLPQELRENPYVLYRETMRLYYSTPWSEYSREAIKETMDTIQSAMKETQRLFNVQGIDFTVGNAEQFVANIDSIPNIYRTKRIDIRDPIGDEPELDKKIDGEIITKGEKFAEWAKWKSDSVRDEQLDKVLRQHQYQLDRANKTSIRSRRDLLQELHKDLLDGVDQTLSKKVYDEEKAIEFSLRGRFDSKKTQPFIDQVRSELDVLNEQVRAIEDAEREMVRQIRQEQAERKRIEDSGEGLVWSEKLNETFKNEDRIIGETYTPRYRRFSKREWDMFKKGPEGWRQWVVEFRREKTQRHKTFQLDLPDLNTWEDAVNAMKWLGESEFGEEISALEGMRESYTRIDSLVNSVESPTGKVEDFVKVLQHFRPEDLESLRGVELFELSRPAVRTALMNVMSREGDEYARNLATLLHNRQNPLGNPGEKITNNDFIDLIYNARYKNNPKNPYHQKYMTLTDAERSALWDERAGLTILVDRIGSGVLLRSEHITRDWNAWDLVRHKQNEYISLHQKLNNPELNLTAAERVKIQKRLDELMNGQAKVKLAKMEELRLRLIDPTTTPANQVAIQDEINALNLESVDDEKGMLDLWRERITLNKYAEFDPLDRDTVLAVKNLSPIEIEAREMVLADLRLKYLKEVEAGIMLEQDIPVRLKKDEWKIAEAIWAASSHSYGFGEMAEIASNLGRCSSVDLKYRLGRKEKPIHFMDRGALELWVRVINPSMFEDDFHMGGPMGDDIRNIFYSICFKLVGYDWKKDPYLEKAYKDKIKADLKKGIPEWVVLMDYAQDVLGMSYSEVVRPELLATGLQGKSTTWRLENSIYAEIRENYDRIRAALPPETSLDHHALGLRLLAAETPAEKKIILQEMIIRTPSEMINLINWKDLQNMTQSQGLNTDSLEWRHFLRALSISEKQLSLDVARKFKPFDFTNEANFNELMPSALKAAGVKDITPEKLNRYFNFIIAAKEYVESAPGGMYTPDAKNVSRIDKWVNHRFKNNFMLGMSSLDWKKDTNLIRICQSAFPRRIGDFMGMAAAGAIRRDIFYDHYEEFLMPRPGKELEMVQKINELRKAIISYDGPETAELAQTAFLDTIIFWNFNRASQSVAGWIPGAVTLLKNIQAIESGREMAYDGVRKKYISFMQRFKSGREFLDKYPIGEIEVKKWPKSIAQFVSYGVKWGGPEGNAWDEYKVKGIFNTVETLGMYQTHDGEKMFRDLRAKFKTGWVQLMLIANMRKYWWVAPTAAVAVALISSYEEEKKKQH